jgi:hypothetical protein
VYLAVFFGGLVAVVALNFVVNPFGYYPVHVLRPLTWSSRQVKAGLLETARYEAVVVGSSHTMKIAPSDVERATGLRTVNASVDSARVEDIYALLSLALARPDCTLKEVVLGIDPEAFHDHLAPDARLLGAAALLPFVPADFKAELVREAGEGLVTFGQVMASLRSLRMWRSSSYPPVDSTFDDDGFLHYVTWEREIAQGTFVPSFDGTVAEYDARFLGFEALSERRRDLFVRLMDDLAARGVRVHAFITPMHHTVRDSLTKKRDLVRLVASLHAFLDDVARTHPSFTWVDYLDPAAVQADPEAFFDGAHPRDETMSRIVAALFGGKG